MSDPSETKDCLTYLEQQVQEIEMLQAMFPGGNELVWHDPTLLLDVQDYLDSKEGLRDTSNLRSLNFQLNLTINVLKNTNKCRCDLQISITLPKCYPHTHPSVSILANNLSRNEQSLLNKDVKEFISSLLLDDMMLYNIISWIQENTVRYVSNCSFDDTGSTSLENKTRPKLFFMLLYMHHIYNKEKRKSIINWANELFLTGFSLPGKPGVVYVEGEVHNIDDYFERLRRMSWKRMSCKTKDECSQRRFNDFQEVSFDAHGSRDYHMDMGKFYKFLKEKDLCYMFEELFGIEGHESTS